MDRQCQPAKNKLMSAASFTRKHSGRHSSHNLITFAADLLKPSLGRSYFPTGFEIT